MPRKRDRITTKASWTVDSLEDAIKTLRRGGSSVYKVSQETGIPYSTLKKRYNLAKANDGSYKCPPKLGRHPVFTFEQERFLADHLRTLSNKFYGLTKEQFRKICYTIAERLSVAERFNKVNKIAGKDWLFGFLQRYPELSIRKPEATSINRILGFNKTEVTRFFDNLERLMMKHNFEPQMIYNVDETGVTTVQETDKIIAPKGQKRVGAVTSWERGKTVTVICAMSASGSFVPPLFIFPRQRHSPQLEKDGPPGAVYTCSHNGWTNENIFILWLRHFIKQTKPTAERPILLVLDNHNSHSTLEAWELARENHVVMLTIPPHSSHRLQPLDVTFYSPLKRAYNKECDMYIKSKNFGKITPYEIAGLFNKAYMRVACIEKGVSGFNTTGIFPMNPAIFSNDDFLVTDEEAGSVDMNVILPTSNDTLQQPVNEQVDNQPEIQQQATPSTSKENQQCGTNIDYDQTDFASIVSYASPMPDAHISSKNKSSKNKQHSEILTSTPMKNVFEQKKKKRIEKQSKANVNKKNKGNCTKENCAKGKCTKGKCTKDEGNKKRQTTTKKYRVKRAKKNFIQE